MKQYNILDCIKNIIKYEYYVTILIEDIIMYYNYNIYEDYVQNDIRTIVLKNHKKDKIIINSIIISFSGSGEKFKQQNKIHFIENNNKKYEWNYIGKCYKSNK